MYFSFNENIRAIFDTTTPARLIKIIACRARIVIASCLGFVISLRIGKCKHTIVL